LLIFQKELITIKIKNFLIKNIQIDFELYILKKKKNKRNYYID
jgi:hypothetical protein